MHPLAALGLIGVLGAPVVTPLVLRLEARKSHLLVGEPTRFEVKWSSLLPISVSTEYLQLFLDEGDGFAAWHESPFTYEMSIGEPATLRPGTAIKTVYSLGVRGPTSGQYQLALRWPGDYRVVARYSLNGLSAVSNTVVLTTTPPAGQDAEIFDHYVRVQPELLSDHSYLLGEARLEAIFDVAAGSIYIARPKLLYLERRVTEAIRAAPDPVPHTAPIEGGVPQALNRLANEDLGDTAFEDSRLLALAKLQDRTGRPTAAVVTWQAIITRFPTGYAAQLARRRLNLPSAP